jgi:hypothetical protein
MPKQLSFFEGSALSDPKSMLRLEPHIVTGRHVWNVDDLKRRMVVVHQEAIKCLSPVFKIRPPKPLPIKIVDDPNLLGSIIVDTVKVEDHIALYKNAWEKVTQMTISTRVKSGLESELTCAHETGHGLHMHVKGEGNHERATYEQREMVAILSSLLFFQQLGQLAEAERLMFTRDAGWASKTERALLKTLSQSMLGPADALNILTYEYSTTNRRDLTELYEFNLESKEV